MLTVNPLCMQIIYEFYVRKKKPVLLTDIGSSLTVTVIPLQVFLLIPDSQTARIFHTNSLSSFITAPR